MLQLLDGEIKEIYPKILNILTNLMKTSSFNIIMRD